MKNRTAVKSLEGTEALDRIKELIERIETCFFCSDIKTGVPLSARPMTALEVDSKGDIWFISKRDSTKDVEIKEDPFVHLLFQKDQKNGFLNIYGLSEVQNDREKIKKLWSPGSMGVWFDGPDDPEISLIRVSPLQGHYWDDAYGGLVSMLKIATSSLLGTAYGENNDEGELKFD
ncbi:pyridoxamine 5'-phosphate oxidase family protein [Olivibacter sp. SDN3]|uniref:pyridoxamine 5'-phosphate oxidase family protein n=1 Tax=Olivibacter sp. SDN3 TaxID=2764720 RepID=UPI001650ED63|nr:pyridoxamine 5'-phosphate oxidase family protein [Olivibacter sp. SDN3]QNL50042.1 pyridoxamine 5'-phosphate oxidase family protein [Olivibacter sp. SDN3]